MHNSVDFHIHSCYSDDGEFTPSELVRMCAEKGIHSMAISDHNSVAGIEEVMHEADELHIHCVPAIEIDCMYHGMIFHVLGYEIDYTSPDFKEIEKRIRRQCVYTSVKRFGLINKLGFHVKEEELNQLTSGSYWPEQWSPKIFAEVLLKSEAYQNHELLRPYRKGGYRSDNPYVNFYLGKPCFVPMNYPDMQTAIDVIHQNHGKAVLAHPGASLHKKLELIEELIPLGLDGLEVYSSHHTRAVAEWFHGKAVRHKLEETRGSDFHGKTKPAVQLGQCKRQ